MTNLKIAYILFRFPTLTETFIAEEIQKIQTLGVNVQVYSLLPSKENLVHSVSKSILPQTLNVPGIFNPVVWIAQVYYLWRNPRMYFRLLWKLLKQPAKHVTTYLQRLTIFFKSMWVAKELQSHQIHLVHTHFAWLSAAASWVVSQLLDVPFTVTTHAFDIYSERNDLLKLITNQAAKVVTISEHNKNEILRMNPNLIDDNVQVIRCGIDLSFFSKLIRSQKTINFPIQITSVGSLIEKKGHEFLIQACANLKKQDIPFQCVVIGSGLQHAFLQNLIQENKLTNDVVLAGKKSQEWVRDRLSQSHLFVLACVRTGDNDQDGIPVAMMEAMAMGLPVISTAVSGIPELIKHGKTGLIVEERDPESLSKEIIRLCDDPELRRTLSRNGHTLVEQEYNINENVKKLKNVISEVLEEPLA